MNNRNCNWDKPGECKNCGQIPYEDTYLDPKTGRFFCPNCDSRVTFGKSEFVLGKTFRTPGCPKSHITERSIFLLNLVDWSERTGKLPTAQNLLDESMFYYEARIFILTEKEVAEEEMRPKEKTK